MLLFALGMPSNKLKRWIFGPLATGILFPFVCIAYTPVGLALDKTAAVLSQALSVEEVERLTKEANQFEQDGDYGSAIAIWEKIVDSLSTSENLNRLASLYYLQGMYSKAIHLYERSIAVLEKVVGTDHIDTATTINELAVVLATQGQYSKAESLLLRALKIFEKVAGADHAVFAIALNDLAELYRAQGFYDKAAPLYVRSIGIKMKALGLYHENTALPINNLGLVYFAQGLYSEAEPLLLQALSIFGEVLGPDHFNVGLVLNNLGELYRAKGQYQKAESFYMKSILVQERALGDYHMATGNAINNLALLYHFQGLNNKAEPLLLRALSIFKKALGVQHPLTGTAMNNLAMVYHNRGMYDKAELLLMQSLEIKEKTLGSNNERTALVINNLGRAYHSQGDYRKAESMYRSALDIYDKSLGADHPDNAVILNNLALAHFDQGNLYKAEPFLRRSISTQIHFIQRESPYLPRSERQSFASIYSDSYQFSFTFAFQGQAGANLALFSRLNRQGLLEEIEKRQAQLSALPGEQQQVAQELRAVTQQLSSLTIKPEQRQALKVRQEEIEKQLYRLLPQLKPRVVEVEQVAKALPADGVLIEFQRYQPFASKKKTGEQWGKARYLAMVLKPDASVTVVDLGEATVIDQAITTAVSATRRGLGDAPKYLAKVSQLLIEPLNSATAGSKTWFVSPDGELNRLPFSALPAPNGLGYFTEAVDLRLLTTGRELLDLQQPNPKAQSAALVVADPAYGQISRRAASPAVATKQTASGDGQARSADLSDQLTWAPLPATAQEGQTIKDITGGSLLVQEQATAEAVKQTPAPKVLHLATHAFYLPNQAKQQPEPGDGLLGPTSSSGVVRRTNLQGESPLLRSGIALAGANQPSANPNDDGYLTALEVAQLAWEGTDLVVISACESGLGDLQVGEGVYGLKRAIAVAGARSSLLSLWKVDDEATKVFMEGFYARLKQGQGRAEALANTQKEFRESPDRPNYRRPYYWAAFQLSGDWKPVKGL